MWIWRLITRQSPAATSTPRQRWRHLQCLATQRHTQVWSCADANEELKHQHISEHVATACNGCCFNCPVIESEMEILKIQKEKSSMDTLLNAAPVFSFILFILYLRLYLHVSVHLSAVSSSLHFPCCSSLHPNSLRSPGQGVHKQTFVWGTNTIHLSSSKLI